MKHPFDKLAAYAVVGVTGAAAAIGAFYVCAVSVDWLADFLGTFLREAFGI